MADNIQIRVDDMRVRVLLERLQARMGNMLPVMDEIGSALLVRVQRTFEREEAPGGGSWQTLAQATIAARQKRKHWPGPILRVTGNLYRSINYRADGHSVTLGAGGPGQRYAAIHQFGGMAGRGRKVRIPARPYLFDANGRLPAPWLGAVTDIMRDHLMGGA